MAKCVKPKKARSIDLKPKSNRQTKEEQVINALRKPGGATVAELSKLTGWLPHSVRGFISGILRKQRGLDVHTKREARIVTYSIKS